MVEPRDLIDIHTHLGYRSAKDKPVVDEHELLRRMDELGIEKAVLLPLGASPECSFFWFGNEAVIDVSRRHPNRFIPFCNLDPRNCSNSPKADFSWILEEYREMGCRGVGEVTANLPLDDPLCMNLFGHCGKAGLPVLIHFAAATAYGLYGLADDKGLPRLENVLKEFPQTTFIGHAMAFWAEISSNVDEKTRGGYPPGPIGTFGRLPHLLQTYPNLYGDLSAGSGFNAISRDPAAGYRFLEECQDKLLFGTDICHVNQKVAISEFLRKAVASGEITQSAYRKIAFGNARTVLGLPE